MRRNHPIAVYDPGRLKVGSIRPLGRSPRALPLRLLILIAILACPACEPSREPVLQSSAGGRVLSLVPSLNELIIAMGAGEHLVARTDFDTHPQILDLPSVGGGLDPNLEAILNLGVGVVLTPGGRDAGALGTRLEDLGLEVHALPTNTVADLYGAIAELGSMFDVPSAADSLTSSMKWEIEEIRGRVADREPVSVMYVVGADPPMTTGSGTFIHDLIRIAGGRNAFADVGAGWPSVGFEAIVNRDPEYLIWPRGAYNTVEVENLNTTPGWRDVPAVRDGRVLFVDGDLFTRPGPGFPEAARILASAFHPGAFEFPPAARP